MSRKTRLSASDRMTMARFSLGARYSDPREDKGERKSALHVQTPVPGSYFLSCVELRLSVALITLPWCMQRVTWTLSSSPNIYSSYALGHTARKYVIPLIRATN